MTEPRPSGPAVATSGEGAPLKLSFAGPFTCFGQAFIIQTPDEELAAFLDELYRPMRVETGPNDVVIYTLLPPERHRPGRLSNGRGLVRTSTRHDRLLEALVWAINRQVIDGPSEKRLIFHAAAADLGGAGLLLPAPTRSGKTTLVTALLDRGFTYLTDEAAAVDAELEIEGFPKPLSVERGSFEVLARRRPQTSEAVAPYVTSRWQLPVERFAPVTRQSRLAIIVFPRYEAGAATRFVPLRSAATVREAFGNVFVPDGTFASAEKVHLVAYMAERTPAATLLYSNVNEACQHIQRGLRHAGSPAEGSAESQRQ